MPDDIDEDEEQWLEELEEERCSCVEDEINLNCNYCYG